MQPSFSAEDADFVFRNVAKTELALGDAVLISFGKYHWSCLERGRRLSNPGFDQNVPRMEMLRRHHAAGIEFKLHPYRSGLARDALYEQHRTISALALSIWLWLENRRLGCEFRSVFDYASNPANKWTDTSSWQNQLANIRVYGPRGLLLPRKRRHPRERILNALGLQLWGSAKISPQLTRAVQRELLWSDTNGP